MTVWKYRESSTRQNNRTEHAESMNSYKFICVHLAFTYIHICIYININVCLPDCMCVSIYAYCTVSVCVELPIVCIPCS